jgi:hypothetical protein
MPTNLGYIEMAGFTCRLVREFMENDEEYAKPLVYMLEIEYSVYEVENDFEIELTSIQFEGKDFELTEKEYDEALYLAYRHQFD